MLHNSTTMCEILKSLTNITKHKYTNLKKIILTILHNIISFKRHMLNVLDVRLHTKPLTLKNEMTRSKKKHIYHANELISKKQRL